MLIQNSVLSINGLTISSKDKTIVKDVSFEVPRGKIVALAGGSGCGKTTIGLSVLRLLPYGLHLERGRILFEGQDLWALSPEEIRQIRGKHLSMVFQDALSAFDPVFTIGSQLNEVLVAHTELSQKQRREKILNAFGEVQLPDPERVYRSYPHQLSGGMRQRAMIAQASILNPALLIADEPTSSLDVTLQIKMGELLSCLKDKGVSILMIAHDWGMIKRLADFVVVLCQGEVVEQGAVHQVCQNPGHEYTKALMEAFQ
ncbi:MAG: ABC transporter ATP-binding protein [Candidatus Omnitrophica bacterium]|nr:ABC transporter ATP-binding protein [Candidatus Omnitrophota bacterium]